MNSKAVGLIVAIAFLWGPSAALAQQGDTKAGQASFDKTCALCHGKDGNSPKEAIAKMFKVEKIPQLGSSEIQAKTDDELKTIITKGFGKMPQVSSLSEKDVTNVIAYVRTLKKP
jgi:mono/diheme cytochrome c family protein